MPYPTQWADYDPNKFMCCLCFEIFNIDQCAVDNAGQKMDVCVSCWTIENYLHNEKNLQHDHNPIQHRDGKPPWCRECGLTSNFRIPKSRFDRIQKHSRRRRSKK